MRSTSVKSREAAIDEASPRGMARYCVTPETGTQPSSRGTSLSTSCGSVTTVQSASGLEQIALGLGAAELRRLDKAVKEGGDEPHRSAGGRSPGSPAGPRGSATPILLWELGIRAVVIGFVRVQNVGLRAVRGSWSGSDWTRGLC